VVEKIFSSPSAQRVAQAADIFRQVRGEYSSLSEFLEGLRSDLVQWKLQHQSNFGILRRIFGIRGIRQMLKQLNHQDSTPTEMLTHLQEILARNGKKSDTATLYNRLALAIQQNTGVQSQRGATESGHTSEESDDPT
jgi:DNA-binding SARP family transcriptional activator